MSYSDEDVEELRMRMADAQENMGGIKKKFLGAAVTLVGLNCFGGWQFVVAAVYLLIGYKMAGYMQYSLKDWELYAVAVAWPLLILIDLVLEAVR